MAGREIGTLFCPDARLASRKYWIAFTLRPRGRLIVDDGAKKPCSKKQEPPAVGSTPSRGEIRSRDPVACMTATASCWPRAVN